jgi:hypothetical protein
MVDIIVTSSHGYRLGALSKWATGVEEPLVTAVADFPKRGIIVSNSILRVAQKCLILLLLFEVAQRSSKMGMEFRLPYPE